MLLAENRFAAKYAEHAKKRTKSPLAQDVVYSLACSYVQNHERMFYFLSSCSQDDERSEESCEHDDRPTTDRVSALNGRR
jgi:hypothetical protein